MHSHVWLLNLGLLHNQIFYSLIYFDRVRNLLYSELSISETIWNVWWIHLVVCTFWSWLCCWHLLVYQLILILWRAWFSNLIMICAHRVLFTSIWVLLKYNVAFTASGLDHGWLFRSLVLILIRSYVILLHFYCFRLLWCSNYLLGLGCVLFVHLWTHYFLIVTFGYRTEWRNHPLIIDDVICLRFGLLHLLYV